MDSAWVGVAAGLAASTFWGFANVSIQRATRAAPVLAALFWGQVLGALALSIGLVHGAWRPSGPPSAPGWLALGGAASALAYVGMFRAFQRGPLSVLSPLLSAWTLIAAALGVVLFDEALPPLRIAGGLLVVAGGAGIVARSEHGGGWHGPRAVALAWTIAAAAGFGVMVATLRPLGADLGPVVSIQSLWAVQWALLIPLAIGRPDLARLPPRSAWPSIAALGLLEAAGFLAIDYGSLVAPISVVAPTSGLGAFVTVVLARIVLGERFGVDRALLAVVVTGGIVLLGMSGQ